MTFKLDFPGNLCRAAFAILAMFLSWVLLLFRGKQYFSKAVQVKSETTICRYRNLMIQNNNLQMLLKKLPSEMEVALLTLFTLFILAFKLLYIAETKACLPIYIVREGWNANEWADA